MMLPSVSISLGLLFAPLALAAVHDVTVGSADGTTLEYSPEAISASVGDQVVFHFQAKNHSVTQSSLASPCGAKEGGFDSGFFPVATNQTDNLPTYTVNVSSQDPIWIFCAQGENTAASHCGKGMVFAINCGADGAANSFTNFKNAALAVGQSLAQSSGSSSSGSGSGYGSSSGTATTDASGSSASSTGTGTSSGSAATHTVLVGGNSSLTFEPAEVSAQPNDVVVFQFQSKNHTVTQSSFAAPCLKQSISNTSATAFDSGFMPVSANATTFPTWSVTINNTAPVWVYCRQTGHCGQGMVMAINAVDNGPKNFTAYKASAIAQNGTSSSGTSSGATSTSTTGAASGASRTMGVAGTLLAAVAGVFVLVL